MKVGLASMFLVCLAACGGEVASAPPPIAPVPTPSSTAEQAPAPAEKLRLSVAVEPQEPPTAGPAAPVEIAYPNRQSIEALDRLPMSFHVVHRARTSVVTLPSDELFDAGDAALKRDADYRLAPLVVALRQQSGKQLVVRAYTDGLGDRAENKRLSSDRAEALRQTLVRKGVNADAITAEGLGAEHPIGDNTTPFGRAENRRLEIVIRPAE